MRALVLALCGSMLLAACGTDLESDPAGNRVAGFIRYPEEQTLGATYGRLGLALFVQSLVADATTGQPTTAAPTPTGVFLELIDDNELARFRADGYQYEIQNINLGALPTGEPLTQWPFVVIASLVDFDVFTTAQASTYFQTSPFGGYPTVCSLSVSTFQVPQPVRDLILSRVGGNVSLQTQIIAAITPRIIGAMASDPRVGSPVVMIDRDVPATEISFDLYDAAQQPTTVVPCKVAIQEIITREVGIALTRVGNGSPP